MIVVVEHVASRSTSVSTVLNPRKKRESSKGQLLKACSLNQVMLIRTKEIAYLARQMRRTEMLRRPIIKAALRLRWRCATQGGAAARESNEEVNITDK